MTLRYLLLRHLVSGVLLVVALIVLVVYVGHDRVTVPQLLRDVRVEHGLLHLICDGCLRHRSYRRYRSLRRSRCRRQPMMLHRSRNLLLLHVRRWNTPEIRRQACGRLLWSIHLRSPLNCRSRSGRGARVIRRDLQATRLIREHLTRIVGALLQEVRVW